MLKKIKNIFLYGLGRIRSVDASTDYTNWLEFANAGMLNKGNIHAFNHAISNLPEDSPVIEIGSFCGLSTNLITHLLAKHKKNNKLFTSDKWIFVGSDDEKMLPNSNISHDEYREFVRESYLRNIKFFSRDRLPYTIEVFSDDFFKLWAENAVKSDVLNREVQLGGSVSFAFIDGNHTYEFVKRDFENTDKYLVKGGFILFDDSADYYDFGSSIFMKDMMKNTDYELVMKNPNYLFKKK